MTDAPYGAATLIADTSAWARAQRPEVRAEWESALRGGQIVTSPIVQLELLFSTRDGAGFDRLAADLAHLRDLPITRRVTDAALQAFRDLAHREPLHHRSVRLPDLLIAATAQDAGVGVLHYDHDFDRLRPVLHFESRWIAPPGTLD